MAGRGVQTLNIAEHNAGIARALTEGGSTHTLEDVLDAVELGEAQLWLEEDACIVTEIHQAPRAQILHFWIATGKLEPVLALRHKVMAWGKERGCTKATMTGRRGWLRALAGTEWRETLALMEADI